MMSDAVTVPVRMEATRRIADQCGEAVPRPKVVANGSCCC